MFGTNCGGNTLVWSSAAAIFLGLTAWWWQDWRRKKNMLVNAIPSQWRAVGVIDELSLFPLKSGRAIQMKEGECTQAGLRMMNDTDAKLTDRTFIVFSEKSGSLKTARQYPKMVLINVSVSLNGKVIFEAPEMSKLEIDVPNPANSKYTACSMRLENLATLDCGDEAAAWFSEYMLGQGQTKGVRLGYHHDTTSVARRADKPPWVKVKKYFTKMRDEDYGVYSDMTSFMLLGASSVAELNTRLATPVTSAWFRPNFVVRGSAPYEEDGWDWIKIGDSAVFRSVKPCTRCILITIDPEKGVIDKQNKEPLNTLKKYRKLTDPAAVAIEGDSPVMGLYMGLHTQGVVRPGDTVYVGCAN